MTRWASSTLHSLAEYPLWQAEAAIVATGHQLVSVGTGEGTNGWIPHTYGIIERYIPAQVKPMRAAHQQHWDFNFTTINRLHIPVALASMLLVFGMLANSIWRRRSTISRCSPGRSRWRCWAMPLFAG